MPYELEPHVAGELGEGTDLDPGTHPPVIGALEYLLDTPDADDLIESFPVYLVSQDLADALVAAGVTGISLSAVTMGRSGQFRDAYRDAPVPPYLRLHPGAGDEDVTVSSRHRLLVSDRAWGVIKAFRLRHCEVSTPGRGTHPGSSSSD